MTAKGKKPAGFLMFLHNLGSWLAGFTVKILSKLATDTHRRLPADMAGKKW
jgi:hypothetical protein